MDDPSNVLTLAARAAVRSSEPLSVQGDLETALTTQSDLVLDLLGSLSALLKPVQKLESLVQFEAMRSEENPMLPALRTVIADVAAALAAHGIVPHGATVGELYDEERHERVARAGVVPSDELSDDLVVREVVRVGYTHTSTGCVLAPVMVHVAPNVGHVAATGAPAAASAVLLETPRGSRMHEVRPTDTLQGIALRYGASPATLMRLNRLPNAQAFHSRKQLKLPPAPKHPLWGPMSAREASSTAAPADAGGAPATEGGAVLVSNSGCSGGADDTAPAAASLAGRIASRRRLSSSRRSTLGRAPDGDGKLGGDVDGHGGGALEAAEEDPIVVREVAAALRSALSTDPPEPHLKRPVAASGGDGAGSMVEGAERQDDGAIIFGGTLTTREPADDCCATWLGREVAPGLAQALASSLLYPWRSVAPDPDPGLEMNFLTALAEQTSERAVRALLSREGELVRDAAALVWRRMMPLRRSGAAASPSAPRQGGGASPDPRSPARGLDDFAAGGAGQVQYGVDAF